MQVQNFLQQQFPSQLNIVGENYPPPPLVALLLQVLQYCQLFGMAWMIVGGERLWGLLGFRQHLPKIYHWVAQNPMPVIMTVYFILPQILNSFVVSGAFEMYLDDDLEIFSKIKQGAFPQAEQLVRALTEAGLKSAATAE